MSEGSSSEQTKKVMKTYVPEGQKAEWVAHADELNMTQSEYLRSMVQAGRRGFTVETQRPTSDSSADGGGEVSLERRVREVLAEEGALDWDSLVAELTSHVEDDLEQVLERLQTANEVRYSGRDGGYQLADSDGGSL